MKKIVFIIALIITNYGYSQVAVTDATANATLSTQLSTATSSLAQLQKSYEILQKSADKIEQINQAVTTIAKIGDVIDMQKEGLSNLNFYMEEVKKLNKKIDTKKVTGILTRFSSLIGDLNKVLTSRFFNMTDKERMDYFQERKNEVTTELLKTRMLKALMTR